MPLLQTALFFFFNKSVSVINIIFLWCSLSVKNFSSKPKQKLGQWLTLAKNIFIWKERLGKNCTKVIEDFFVPPRKICFLCQKDKSKSTITVWGYRCVISKVCEWKKQDYKGNCSMISIILCASVQKILDIHLKGT